MKVLVATDDRTFNVGLTAEYLRRGFDVHVGTTNLFLKQQPFDLIHCHWPEELAGWQVPPDPRRATEIIEVLDWWRERTTLLMTAHNLLPHAAAEGDRDTAAFYDSFLRRMHHVGHFSTASMDAVAAAFPAVPPERHFVHGMNLFDEMRGLSPGRQAARRSLGIDNGQFAVATFGQLRSLAELRLVTAAIDGLSRKRTTVLFAARLPKECGGRRGLVQRWRHQRWGRGHDVRSFPDYLSSAETASLMEAADALIIPRFTHHLNSGLLPLAMTFGTPVAAPDYGVYRELLGGSLNALYAPGDAGALARALQALAAQDAESTRAQNRDLGADWGWEKAVSRIVAAIRRD